MIPRYTRPEMAKIWTDQNKYQIWFEIEAYAVEAMEKIDLVPKGVSADILKKGKFNVEEILEIEKTTKHDVIAFLTNLAESIGENSRFVHMGMTSSDILDTCFSTQLLQSSKILISLLNRILVALKEKALEHKNAICVGRSHGIHAEVTTFGLKMARFYAEFERNKTRLESATKDACVCAISGAVGTFATIDPSVQKHVAEKLGLGEESISTQIIPRDRYAHFFTTLGLIASSIENIATEIRHLQRTEVLEVEEFFSKGQKGSSAMPHKRNPVLSENLTGLARVVRSAVTPMLENVTLWHERDISHSSVERTVGVDAVVTLDFALNRLLGLVENLLIYPENMKKNLDKLNGLVFSQRVLISLIEKAGISREDSYAIVQRSAMKVWQDGVNFADLLKNDPEVNKHLSNKQIDEIFNYQYYTKNIGVIFNKVFG
ncbi:adenylosuccinate lyase [Flavobacteriaceae bacterium]|nr:adenylosuccinate lyase [Flavobacteriaceae bacterium]